MVDMVSHVKMRSLRFAQHETMGIIICTGGPSALDLGGHVSEQKIPSEDKGSRPCIIPIGERSLKISDCYNGDG